MPKLCLITLPGLEVGDWRLVHDRLLDEFPAVTDVLPTTLQETILVVHRDASPGDASKWLDTVSETVLHRRRVRTVPTGAVSRRRDQVRTHPRRAFADPHPAGLRR